MEISHITIHSGIANIGNRKWLLFNSELKCTEESVISIFNAPLVFPWCDFTFIYESWDSKSEDTQLWLCLEDACSFAKQANSAMYYGHPVTSSMAWDSKSENT